MLKAHISNVLRAGRRAWLGLAIAATVLSADATAQCPVPDGLDGGPCCALAQPNFPKVPKFAQDSMGICWLDCNVDAVADYRAIWTPFLSGVPGNPCQPLVKRLRLLDSSGALAWSGLMRQQYSRTWEETNPTTGDRVQVWRYLVNGDLIPTAAAGPIPCPVPPCAPVFNNRVRFTGYVDLARGCVAGASPTEYAWMITHACDAVDHAPGFPRGGGFHPDRAYTFLGPRAGFAPGPLQPIEAGGGGLEARRVTKGAGLGHQCQFEEPVNYGISPNQNFCLCGIPSGPPQWQVSSLSLGGACGTTITTPGGPFLPGFMSMGLGTWTTPGTYPGLERLRWNCGGYDYFEPCTPVPPQLRQEVFFGVTTIEGWPARQVLTTGAGVTLPLTFIDQANSLRGTMTLMNLPFTSDHIVNLNL